MKRKEIPAHKIKATAGLYLDCNTQSMFGTTAHGGSGFWQQTDNPLDIGAPGNSAQYFENLHLRGNVEAATLSLSGTASLTLASYADNAAAILGGLSAGQLYHTAGIVKIVI